MTKISVRTARHLRIEHGVDDAGFLKYARAYGANPGTVVLLSGGDLDCSRYSIIGCNPFMTFTSKGDSYEIHFPGGSRRGTGDPLAALDDLFDAVRPDFSMIVRPFSGGAMGYFAYDLKNVIERLPQTVLDDHHLPDIYLTWPRRIYVHDRRTGSLDCMELICEETDGWTEGAANGRTGEPKDGWTGRLEDVSSSIYVALCAEAGAKDAKERERIPGVIPGVGTNGIDTVVSAPPRSVPMRVGALESNFAHEAYLDAVRKIRRYIRQGDVYQVNLSQRFEFPFQGDPFVLWESLFALNPAPFYSFIHAGDHQVLSTSMERFLFRDGTTIETRPIKGTRKRGETPMEDRTLREDLLGSPKDDAELSMIVDLLRNDLGRVCRPRSIKVAEHKRIEAYRNVYHLISIVTGELDPEVTHGEILRATFPGGSITGCPKIRAMEVIDELEPHARHIYTGSIGYLGWHGNLDLNIAIRTALVHGERCCWSVGGAVVYDSREEDEYQETLHKGRTMFEVIEKLGEGREEGGKENQ